MDSEITPIPMRCDTDETKPSNETISPSPHDIAETQNDEINKLLHRITTKANEDAKMDVAQYLNNQAAEAAERFIRNVVFIDNEAYMGPNEGGEHPINAAVVTKEFAKRKISCAVYRPEEADDLIKLGTEVISHNDAVILDWQLSEGPDKTRRCKELIKTVLENDTKTGNPFRFILVYSGENPIDVSKDLHKYIKEQPQLSKLDKNETCIEGINLRIVFAKKKSQTPQPQGFETGYLELEPSELPETVIRNFAELAGGILPCAALHAISALRERAHIFISSFRKELDPALILHSTATPQPSDSYDFIIQLLKEEMLQALEADISISNTLRPEVFSAWYKQHEVFKDKDGNKILHETMHNKLLNQAEIKDFNTLKAYGNNNTLKDFSRLSSLKREYGVKSRPTPENWNPTLEQGVILKHISADKYYMCIMPKCDCCRLNETTKFPFIELTKASSAKDIDLYIFENNQNISMRLQKKKIWENIVNFSFNPDKKLKKVVAALKSDGYFFDSETDSFKWIADVKDSFLIYYLQKRFGTMNRIGIDVFEWHREAFPNALRNQ